MLTQLSTVKARLGIAEFEIKDDVLLTNAIAGFSARFDLECNRRLARAAGVIEEFDARQTELAVGCYPIESITRFELKTNETDGRSRLASSMWCGARA